MLDTIFPKSVDNTYRGFKVALWILGLVVVGTILQGVMVIFNGYSTIMRADGIPLNTYSPDATQTILSLWALRGLARVILSLLGVLALVRYRSAVPFMFVLLMVNYLASLLIFQFIPVVRTGSPPGPTVNLVMFGLMIIGFALSIWSKRIRS